MDWVSSYEIPTHVEIHSPRSCETSQHRSERSPCVKTRTFPVTELEIPLAEVTQEYVEVDDTGRSRGRCWHLWHRRRRVFRTPNHQTAWFCATTTRRIGTSDDADRGRPVLVEADGTDTPNPGRHQWTRQENLSPIQRSATSSGRWR